MTRVEEMRLFCGTQGATGMVYRVYDLAGHMITEVNSSGGWNRGEVFAGGHHIATYAGGTTYFTHADWIGTAPMPSKKRSGPRCQNRTESARTDASGALTETCQSLPYGDGPSCTGTDVSELHFTGKLHDAETGIDYFGSRYDASSLGRFMTPDWSATVEPVPYAKLGDPQTLNLYAYVTDNPTTLTDPTGHSAPPQPSPGDGALVQLAVDEGALIPIVLENPSVADELLVSVAQKDAEKAQQAAQNAQAKQKTAQQQNEKEVEAEVYGEKTNGTVDEYKAMASVIVNRANSGKAVRQYVQKGQDVNIQNVVSNTKQLQAYGGTNYNNFYNGSPRVSQTTRTNVETAVTSVFSHGATTEATFFIAPPSGAPTSAEVRALGNVTPANPASVGGVYLYVIKPPGP